MTQIAFLLYDQMTALDAVGPYDVLARLPGAEVKFVASTPGPIQTDVGMVRIPDSPLDAVPAPDIVDTVRVLQLAIEYDPQPPFDSGSLEKADAETRERATRYFAPATSA